jgi:hypothetical protein
MKTRWKATTCLLLLQCKAIVFESSYLLVTQRYSPKNEHANIVYELADWGDE